MYRKSCAKILQGIVRKEVHLKVACTIKVMMIIYLSESMCKKLCVNVVFVSYDFPKKKIGKKRSEKRMRYAVGDRALVGLLSRARNRGALRTRAHARHRTTGAWLWENGRA